MKNLITVAIIPLSKTLLIDRVVQSFRDLVTIEESHFGFRIRLDRDAEEFPFNLIGLTGILSKHYYDRGFEEGFEMGKDSIRALTHHEQ